jgi:hypothetical protein
MKKIILFLVVFAFIGCKEVHHPEYTAVFESQDAILLKKAASSNSRTMEYYMKDVDKKWYLDYQPIITYSFWFLVRRENTGDTIKICVPHEIYDAYNPGDRLKF